MPEPLSPKPPAKTTDSLVTQSSVNADTNSYRAGEGDPDEINVASFLAPPEGEGEIGRLAHYRILKELGRGGMGMVLMGEDSRLRRMAAIKVMLPKYARDPQARERFLREARAAARINHDNVVRIHQVDEANGIPFIAMEFLEGEPLDQHLKDKGELPIGQAVRIGREIAEGLQAAHAKGLIHRDIKPANVWLEAPKGRVKILDFGLAQAEERDDTNLTKSGAVVGTPAYMSPEQAYGKPLDPRSDLFSLGVVLYRLCTGKQPFTGPNTMAVLMALGTETPAPVRQLNPNVPVALEQLIQRLMAKDRDQRPASAEEVAEALAAIEKPNNTGMPEVVYVVPQATAVENDPFANIDATSTEVPVKKPTPKKPAPVSPDSVGKALRSGARAPDAASARSRSKKPLLIGGAVVAIALLAGGFYAVSKMTKDKPSTENTSTESAKKNDETKLVAVATPPALLKAPFSKQQAEKARAEWAAYLKVPERKQLDLPNGVKLDLVLIPPGRFRMGTEGNTTKEVAHDVTISKPFYMAVTETTQEQYEAVDGQHSSAFSAKGRLKAKLGAITDTAKFPVEQVNWFQAEAYCKAIKAKLPTEAQWEYACRAGTRGDFHFGISLNGIEANCDGTKPFGTSAKGPMLDRTTKVASYQPNAFGLYDMHGNVKEWCRDWYGEKMDDLGEEDPERTVKLSDGRRVLRVVLGSQMPTNAVLAYRIRYDPWDGWLDSFGFRVVVALPFGDMPEAEKDPIAKVEPKKADPPPFVLPTFDEKEAKKQQEDWATKLKLPVEATSKLGIKMILIPPAGRRPKAYYLGKYEVTQAEWEKVMGHNPSYFGPKNAKVAGMDTSKFPVESVSWFDSVEFCNKLSEQEGLKPYYDLKAIKRGGKDGKQIDDAEVKILGGDGYHIPTDAEWTWGCAAGAKTKYHFGDRDEDLQEYGWFKDNSDGRTHAVGEKKPNAFGLFDMHGNVREWNEEMLSTAATGAPWRVLRGGDWSITAGDPAVSDRGRLGPAQRHQSRGLRLARLP